MKKSLPIFLLLVLSLGVYAQADKDVYQQEYVQLYKAFAQDPTDVANLVDMAEFFADSLNPQYNLPLAIGYYRQAEDVYTKWVNDPSRTRDLRKLVRKGITIATLRGRKNDVESKAVAYVRQHVEAMKSYESVSFLEAFSGNKEVVKLLQTKGVSEAYRQVCEENTIDGYYSFECLYPAAKEVSLAEAALSRQASRYFSVFTTEAAVDSAAARYAKSPSMQKAAMHQKSSIAYINACRSNTIDAYSSYMERYPRGENYLQALERLQSLRSIEYATLVTPEELADFAESHTDDPLADSALAKLRGMIENDHNKLAAQIYLQRFPLDESHSRIYKEYYRWFSREGNRQPIEAFANQYPDYPFQQSLRVDLAKGALIDRLDLTKPYFEADYDTTATIIRLLTGRRVAYVGLQRILQQLIAHKDWAGAKRRAEQFEICFEDVSTDQYGELLQLLSSGNGPQAQQVLVGDSISHVLPGFGGNTLYYTRVQQGVQSICYARKVAGKNGGWKTMGKVEVKGAPASVCAYNFYDKGKRVLLGINHDIWTALVEDDTLFVLDQHLPSPVNTSAMEQDAFMLEDGSGILFASDRQGGHNVQKSGSYYHGDHKMALDIYYVPLAEGRWGDAVNLGMQVNTSCCEYSPILSRNMRTLYYITDSRGLGYGDVYKVTRTDVDDWQHWSEPVNVGRGVNGAFDEISIAFSPTERQIFLASASQKSGQVIASSFATQHDTASAYRMVKVDFSMVKSFLRNASVAEVWRQDLSSTIHNAELDTIQTFRFYKGKKYAVLAMADWLYVPTVIVGEEEKGVLPVRGYTLDELRSLTAPITLSLVQFYSGTPRLLPLAEEELRYLGRYMLQRTTSKVNITVHAQDVDDRQSYDLSLERAMAVRAFLVDYGVDSDRITLSAQGNRSIKTGTKSESVEVRFL